MSEQEKIESPAPEETQSDKEVEIKVEEDTVPAETDKVEIEIPDLGKSEPFPETEERVC